MKRRGQGPQGTYIRLVRECLRFPVDLFLALAGAAGLGAAGLSLAWLVKRWAEGSLSVGGPERFRSLLGQAILLTAAAAVGLFASRYFTASVNQKLLERLRGRAVDRVFALQIRAVRRFAAGDLLSRVFNDVWAVGGFVETGLKRIVGDGIFVLGAVTMMFFLEWRLALAALLLVPLVGLVLASMGKMVRRWSAVAQGEIGSLSALLDQQIQGMTTIKIYGAEEFERVRFAKGSAGVRRRLLRVELWSALLMGTVFLVTGVALAAAIGWMHRAVDRGQMTLPDLLTFCLYAAMTIEPLRRLAQVQTMLQRALAAAERVYEVIDRPGEEETAGTMASLRVRGEVRYEEVAFAYDPSRRVLDGFDLHVNPAGRVAIVAASGGGKTTLGRLLVRFEVAQGGRVVLDGRDVREWPLAELRRAVCVVEQEPLVFSGRLLDNVRYGSWTAPRSAIEEAVSAVGLEPLIRSLPRGLDTELAEAGRDLSGGERQRIALARAILRNPAVLILDEATNALDGEAEKEIFDRLEPWLARRTVLVFAHRLSTVARFPDIALLQAGKISELGPSSELIARSSVFRSLFSEQAERRSERVRSLASVALE